MKKTFGLLAVCVILGGSYLAMPLYHEGWNSPARELARWHAARDLAGSHATAPLSADEVLALPPTIVGNGNGNGNGNGSSGVYTSSDGIVFATTTTSAVLVTSAVSNSSFTYVSSAARIIPRFTIYCTDEICDARGVGMEQAREMLERIASRGIQIDITVDQNCHPQRESIPARRPEIASND